MNAAPKRRLLLRGAAAVTLALAVAEEGRGEPVLAIDAAFPGGSAETVAIDAAAAFIHIRPALREGRGWPCWWYFEVKNAVPGREMTLRVSGNPGPFRPGGKALAASWAQPRNAAISTDRRAWSRTPAGEFDTEAHTATYRFSAPAKRFWLAWGPPFLPADADELLETAAKAVAGAEIFTLARTRGDRPVRGIRLGAAEAPAAIWVQARQHAWEAGGSWVGRGFLDWIAGDAPEAVRLRERTEIFFVPIMDIDNAAQGAGGKEAVPRDHNRDWSDTPVYPEVAAAQRRIAALEAAGRLRLFVDLHNPGPGDKEPFFYGPFDHETMTGGTREHYDRWIALAAEEISGPLPLRPTYRFATYVTTEEERGRMSSGWVRNHSDPARVVSVTLETAWNTPHSTAEGYRTVGGQLARAVARYLGETASK
ncbi:MAG: zinc carboxypeptidase [Akkermansiaceae bacterium]|nr:zinc carboxypeptidase [Akkermansiaceae bacterium]